MVAVGVVVTPWWLLPVGACQELLGLVIVQLSAVAFAVQWSATVVSFRSLGGFFLAWLLRTVFGCSTFLMLLDLVDRLLCHVLLWLDRRVGFWVDHFLWLGGRFRHATL